MDDSRGQAPSPQKHLSIRAQSNPCCRCAVVLFFFCFRQPVFAANQVDFDHFQRLLRQPAKRSARYCSMKAAAAAKRTDEILRATVP